MVPCQSCGRVDVDVDPYTIAAGGHPPATLKTFLFCPSCAVTLVDEIAATIPDRYTEVLGATVDRRLSRRAELAA